MICKKCKKDFPLKTRIVKGVEVPLQRCDRCLKKHNEKQKKYARGPVGMATLADYTRPPESVEAHLQYMRSAPGKASLHKYRTGKKGIQSKKRSQAKQKLRRVTDSAFAMVCNIRSAACRIAKGITKRSPTFVERTSFTSVKHFRAHLEKNIPSNTTMGDYGTAWEIEHAIPVEAYDFSNPVDIKRCWSPANVRGMAPVDNEEKGVTIIDSLCMQVGANNFPLSWGGQLLAHQEKEAFYRECRAAWNQDDSD